MRRIRLALFSLCFAAALMVGSGAAAEEPGKAMNPCGAKDAAEAATENPCNPCASKAKTEAEERAKLPPVSSGEEAAAEASGAMK